MQTPFNGLTPAEAERIAMLAEEAGEVVQACMKILRHGWDSYNPDIPAAGSNRHQLVRELGDLSAVRQLMLDSDDIRAPGLRLAKTRKMDRMRRYTHHQDIPAEPESMDH